MISKRSCHWLEKRRCVSTLSLHHVITIRGRGHTHVQLLNEHGQDSHKPVGTVGEDEQLFPCISQPLQERQQLVMSQQVLLQVRGYFHMHLPRIVEVIDSTLDVSKQVLRIVADIVLQKILQTQNNDSGNKTGGTCGGDAWWWW